MGIMRMNVLDQISDAVKSKFPLANALLDKPRNRNASSFLDLELDGHTVTVELRPKKGFGITANPNTGYGEGPEEVFDNPAAVIRRVIELVVSRARTIAPTSTLGQLRRERRITQTQLADSLNVRQATIAKVEKRSDVLVSTMQTLVRAMGGQLKIRAEFPDGVVRELEFKNRQDPEKKKTRPLARKARRHQ